MYDPQSLLQSLDEHRSTFLALGTITMIFNYIYFGGAIVAARRDRVFAFPLVCSTIWFAHDLSFVLKYHEWFAVYDHWYLKLFWLGLIPTTLFEIGFIYQAWHYGQPEIMPTASRQSYLVFILGAVAAGCIGWWSVKYFLADPIYAYTFGSTGYLSPVFAIRRMLARGDTGGQSVPMWAAYVGMTTCWITTTYLFFGPDFRSAPYLVMGAASIAGGIFMTVTVLRARRPATGYAERPVPA